MIDRIFVERRVLDYPELSDIFSNFKGAELIEVCSLADADKILCDFPDPFLAGKKSLYLGFFSGRFFKPCPCTRGYFSCGYFVLNPLIGCPFDCSYCVLLGYRDSYPIIFYLNYPDLFKELEEWEGKNPDFRIRLGTGELADSLALEKELGLHRKLIKFFNGKKQFIFELKTKSSVIEPILGEAVIPNLVISFSVSPQKVVDEEERGTASLLERLNSASILSKAGFNIGFHFDPVIMIENWEEEYSKLVKLIFQKVEAERILWISIGTLRFSSRVKKVVEDRFPMSEILLGELVPGKDGKFRYPGPLRDKVYRMLVSEIRAYSPKATVYFCMESSSRWSRFLGNPLEIYRRLND